MPWSILAFSFLWVFPCKLYREATEATRCRTTCLKASFFLKRSHGALRLAALRGGGNTG